MRVVIRRERDALGLTWREISKVAGFGVREVQARSESCKGLEVPAAVRGPADLSEAPMHEGKKVDPRLAPLMGLIDKTKKGS